MLRGAQTPGELKQRTERLHAFAGLGELEETLERLIGRELVVRIGRRPGQKEDRFEQLVGGAGEEAAAVASAPAAAAPTGPAPAAPPAPPEPRDDGLAGRVEALESAVEELREQVGALRRELGT
jgi:uncharacterized protein YceH (UPF0502 family)